jgi:hypothetical protein
MKTAQGGIGGDDLCEHHREEEGLNEISPQDEIPPGEFVGKRLEPFVRELTALLDEPYNRELFEQIVKPLHTLRITLPELEKSLPCLLALGNIHIARYLDSDLEANDSLDEALGALSLSQTNFPNEPITMAWYPTLIKRHIEKFLSTANIEILDRLIHIFSQLRLVSNRLGLEHQVSRREVGELFEKIMKRFTTQTADFRDLHRALKVYNEYESYMAIKDPYMPVQLLCRLTDASGTWSDADRTFRLMELAMKRHQPTVGCFSRPDCVCIKTVFAVQRLKYNCTKNATVLDESIATAGAFLADSVKDAKARSYINSELAKLLETRGKLRIKNTDQKGAEEDLHQAMTLAETELEEKPARSGAANTVANICECLYNLTKERAYVDKAITILLAECDLSESLGQPEFPGNCYDAGFLLLKRNRAFHDTTDRVKALEILKRGYEYAGGNLEMRIFCAQEAAEAAEAHSSWVEASSLYRLTIDLMRSFELQHMKNVDRQRKVSQFGLIATSGAASLLNAGSSAAEALCLLESGRDILAGSIRELRGDISRLQDAYPVLAKTLITLRETLDVSRDTGATSNSTTESTSELFETDRHYGARQLRKLIHEIRKLPGFNQFLATATVEEMMSVAQHGPVIVLNCSRSRCDALLVTADRVSDVLLPIKRTHVIKQVRQLKASGVSFEMLKWLWDMVVSPVLEALGYHEAPLNGKYPRVWWIPTGHFSLLPIHAAGIHVDKSCNTVIDRVMSSYATSFTSLVDGSQRAKINQRSNSSTAIRRAVLVSMSTTPGLGQRSELPFAEKEIQEVNGLLASLKIEVVEPSPNHEQVLNELRHSQILHFAGHGQSHDIELSASSILLRDWQTNPLTTEHIRSTSLAKSPRFLAYLSACSTGPSENAATPLMDENIHLISSFGLAGYRHVVGALWEVQDEYCVDVARIFYETLRDEGISDEAVCLALHRATRALRNRTISTVVKVSSSLTKVSVKLNAARSTVINLV